MEDDGIESISEDEFEEGTDAPFTAHILDPFFGFSSERFPTLSFAGALQRYSSSERFQTLSFAGALQRFSSYGMSEGSGAMARQTQEFTEDLPAAHSYLGDNLEEVSGRKIYTEFRYVKLPIITGSFGPLLPGQTFPLNLRDLYGSEMIRNLHVGDHTFGCVSQRQVEGRPVYGTTAEIYEYGDELNGRLILKAKGRQRFKIMNMKESLHNLKMADVFILPEVKLQNPFSTLNFQPLSRLGGAHKERGKKLASNLLAWPKWVYDMYDPEKLVERANKIDFLKQGLRTDKARNIMPKDPTELSFWIASHLDSKEKLFMLQLNCPIQRLRWLLNFVTQNQEYICNSCDAPIGKQSDIFVMSVEGAQSTYVNSEGYHHDTITLIKADNILPISSPSTHFSWFPGYAWSIAVCRQCQSHLGWQFIATAETRTRPKKFWGLSRNSLQTQISYTADSYEGPSM